MTRSRCRSKSRSNRLKRNKTKRYRQTKNKRHRQHGGEVKYPYTLNSVTILKEGAVNDPVLIPGYSEIMDMMQEYDDPRDSNPSKKLNDGIKIKNVERLSDCSLPTTQIPEDKIIVVRKAEKSILRFALGNNSIECTPEQYYALASHNFMIFIRDILKWNPFLNLPEHKKKQELHQIYGGVHEYSSDKKFKQTDWWESQTWWTDCKETFASAAPQPPAQSRTSSSQPSSPLPSSPLPPPQSVDLSPQSNVELEQQRAKLRILTIGLNGMKTTLNDLHTQEKITEEVKTTLTTQIDTLLPSTQQLPSS